MKEKIANSIPIFLIRVMIIHTLTYFAAGMLASNILNYRAIFELPIIRDYMVEFGTGPIFLGPFVQPIRGLIIGLVLVPFRSFLAKEKYGWLHLWLIFVGIGILSTPAAAPGSVEGVIYTKLPLWYHFFGMPEILTQTLAFSILTYLYMRYPSGIMDALPPVYSVTLQSISGACFAFIGYAIASIAFALLGNVDINAEANMSLRAQGLFFAPFACNFAIITFFNLSKFIKKRGRKSIFLVTWLSNAVLIAAYQQIFLGGANIVYVIVAPILPAIIITLMLSKRVKSESNRNTSAAS